MLLLLMVEDVQEENPRNAQSKNALMEREEKQNVPREVPRNAQPKDALPMEREENPDVPRNAHPDVVIKHSSSKFHRSYENKSQHHAFFYFEYPNLNSKHRHDLGYMSFSNYIST